MPFTKTKYPQSLKNMTEEVRSKAIEIINALLEKNRDEQKAIAIGVKKAEEWAASRDKQIAKKGVETNLPVNEDGKADESLKKDS